MWGKGLFVGVCALSHSFSHFLSPLPILSLLFEVKTFALSFSLRLQKGTIESESNI